MEAFRFLFGLWTKLSETSKSAMAISLLFSVRLLANPQEKAVKILVDAMTGF